MLDEMLALARSNPAALRERIRSRRMGSRRMGPLEHSFALEALGYTRDPEGALPLLFAALEDGDALIREGAVHGLGQMLEEPTVRELLTKIAATDASLAVRGAAEGWL